MSFWELLKIELVCPLIPYHAAPCSDHVGNYRIV